MNKNDTRYTNLFVIHLNPKGIISKLSMKQDITMEK